MMHGVDVGAIPGDARRAPRFSRIAGVLGALVVLAGCATQDLYRVDPIAAHLSGEATGENARCAALFARLDQVTDGEGARDARASRMPGFPYLRSDRLLAALAERGLAGEALGTWLRAAAAMDDESRRNEIAQLSDVAIHSVAPGTSRDALHANLRACRAELAGADLARPGGAEALRAAAPVPAEYQAWKRALGLYPLTRIPFARGVRQWQVQTEAVFNTPLAGLPRKGNLALYVPPARRHAAGELTALFSDQSRNALGLYEWSDNDRAALFDLYAPRFAVDEATGDDKIGAIEWDAEGRPWVNIFRPTVYRRLTHTFMGGRWLAQFVYSVWFPARPAEGPFDALAGKFDGLIWRVTVGPDGHPLVYDTIHPCGCYHLFFPTERVRARPGSSGQASTLDETLFAPQALERIRAGESLALHVESGTHYLRRVAHESGSARPTVYEFAEDDELRSLPLPAPDPSGSVRRNLFGPDGILAGSERAERFFFWPMGINNAGAMRQWGRHATAFVGRRHFDDPTLMDSYFDIQN